MTYINSSSNEIDVSGPILCWGRDISVTTSIPAQRHIRPPDRWVPESFGVLGGGVFPKGKEPEA